MKGFGPSSHPQRSFQGATWTVWARTTVVCRLWSIYGGGAIDGKMMSRWHTCSVVVLHPSDGLGSCSSVSTFMPCFEPCGPTELGACVGRLHHGWPTSRATNDHVSLWFPLWVFQGLSTSMPGPPLEGLSGALLSRLQRTDVGSHPRCREEHEMLDMFRA